MSAKTSHHLSAFIKTEMFVCFFQKSTFIKKQTIYILKFHTDLLFLSCANKHFFYLKKTHIFPYFFLQHSKLKPLFL